MNNKVIIYKQDDGHVAIVIPTLECLQLHTIQEIAIKDVPEGKPFRILDVSELPINIPQEAWTIDDGDLNSGVGGPLNEFI